MAEEYNLYPIRVFQIVAKAGSVTQAAEELGISQPAVSAQLRSLENRIGGPLFERTPRGMVLTPAGRVLSEHAGPIFARMEDMRSAVGSALGQVRGEVTIASSGTPGAHFLPKRFRRFTELYPDVEPVITLGDSAQVLDWMYDYRAQLGVVGEVVMGDGLERRKLAEDELRLVASTDDPLCQAASVTNEAVTGRTLFLREKGSSTRTATMALLGGRMPYFRRIVELNSTEAILQMVVAGLGVAVLSSWSTQLAESAGHVCPARDPSLRQTRRFYLIHRADRPLVGAAQALWNFLVEEPH